MDFKKSGGGKTPRHQESSAKGGKDNPFGPKKKAHESDDPKGKTDMDKPSTGEGEMAIDESGGKNIRGPEGHAKDRHDSSK